MSDRGNRKRQRREARKVKEQRRRQGWAARQEQLHAPVNGAAVPPLPSPLLAFLLARQGEGQLYGLKTRDTREAGRAMDRVVAAGGEYMALLCRPRGRVPFAAVVSTVTACATPRTCPVDHRLSAADLARLCDLGTRHPAWHVTVSDGWRVLPGLP
jgi:hypothetical protein